MQIKEIKLLASEFLTPQKDDLAVEMILGEVMRMSKEKLFVEDRLDLTELQEQRFWSLLELFRDGKPVAQILGTKEFYGLDFEVNGDVLIPRPETELVVDLARDYMKKYFVGKGEVRVLDVGSGSGCIIVALAQVESSVKGFGLEISGQAIEVARRNAEKLGVAERVEFIQSDLLGGLGNFEDKKFDIILANLPYIGTERFNFVAHDVAKYEPNVALFGGLDGLDLYRKLFMQLRGLKLKPAVMIGEFGFGQEEEMRAALEKNFGDNFTIIPDLAGIPRVFVINFNKIN